MGRFDDLSDFDFELLVADLLGRDLRRRFETFPRGRDGGIDLRARFKRGFHLVQCKHYAYSAFSTLERAARRELRVLDRLDVRPRRYTFVTSRRLTAGNKKTLAAALGRLVRGEQDIMGEADVTALLRAHPDIERSHVKLWLRSTAQLQRITNAEIFARSEALIDSIRASLPRYVQTSSFADAHAVLNEHRVVIIAGPPGVGKTTLARLLLLDAAERGFVPYSVQSDIAEAWKLFAPEQPQVFFYDDFLGRTSLFDNVNNDARDLSNFIGRIRRSRSTRLVLATREYVLQQARQDIEELHWKELEADKYSLTLDQYSRFDRARIFYNHVYFSSDVDMRAKTALVANRSYLRVIDHPSYSPRLIEWMTGLGGMTLSERELDSFPEFCVSVLDDPEGLWRYAYDKGLDESAQCLLLQLPGLSTWVKLSDLERAYRTAAGARGITSSRRQFEASLKVLQDSFLRLQRLSRTEEFASVLNPSLIDFLKRRLLEDEDERLFGAQGAHYFEQVDFLVTLAADGNVIDEQLMKALISAARETIERPPPEGITEHFQYESQRSDLIGRVATMAGWCSQEPWFRLTLVDLVDESLERIIFEVGTSDGASLRELPSLARRLSREEFDVEALRHAIKKRAVEMTEDIDAYDALAELRSDLSAMFSITEWADVLDQFSSWATDRLEEAGAWFDDVEDLDRLEDVAYSLGLALPDYELESAREDLERIVHEREAEALNDVDPNDYRDDEPPDVSTDHNDDAHIDSLFGMLEADDL